MLDENMSRVIFKNMTISGDSSPMQGEASLCDADGQSYLYSKSRTLLNGTSRSILFFNSNDNVISESKSFGFPHDLSSCVREEFISMNFKLHDIFSFFSYRVLNLKNMRETVCYFSKDGYMYNRMRPMILVESRRKFLNNPELFTLMRLVVCKVYDAVMCEFPLDTAYAHTVDCKSNFYLDFGSALDVVISNGRLRQFCTSLDSTLDSGDFDFLAYRGLIEQKN